MKALVKYLVFPITPFSTCATSLQGVSNVSIISNESFPEAVNVVIIIFCVAATQE